MPQSFLLFYFFFVYVGRLEVWVCVWDDSCHYIFIFLFLCPLRSFAIDYISRTHISNMKNESNGSDRWSKRFSRQWWKLRWERKFHPNEKKTKKKKKELTSQWKWFLNQQDLSVAYLWSTRTISFCYLNSISLHIRIQRKTIQLFSFCSTFAVTASTYVGVVVVGFFYSLYFCIQHRFRTFSTHDIKECTRFLTASTLTTDIYY